MDFAHLEKKWQLEWDRTGMSRPEPEGRKKFFITVAYPYPSGAMHVGHVRTYTVPDVIAKFKKMQGYNVLFPMAWHVTGTPIIGALSRLKEGEKKQIHVLKDVFKVPDKELKKMKEPMDFANYFIEKHYKYGMSRLGLSIDWRREFTTNDSRYRKFIEWQYKSLKEKGLVKKGKHPVRFCLKSKDPVTAHDLLEGEDAEISKFTLVKFRLDSKTIIPAATLRPETVYGTTNLWVNPASALCRARVGREEWIISEGSVEKLASQGKRAKVLKKINGMDLIGKKVKNPVTGEHLLILPAHFVGQGQGTGIVMSVPAHAPNDLVALKELDEKVLNHHGIKQEEVRKIKPIAVVSVKGSTVEEEVRNSKILHQDDPLLEKITKDAYKREFHHGTLNEKCGKYKGRKVSEAKDMLIKDFKKAGHFDEMYDFNKRVICRDGGRVIVAEKDSWFLDYGDKKWKSIAAKVKRGMNVVPEYMSAEYDAALGWLEDWPCIRNYGLGTPLPWDKGFIIEPLSDSTIYMAFYSIAHLLKKISPDKLKKELFDYIFLGKGTLAKVCTITGIPKKELEGMRKSFEYWYPLDWNCSAHELIKNHMTFMMYHHGALFREKHWPKGQASWGIGLLESQKMASSKGIVLLASDAIEQFGSDSVRLFLMSSVEPWQDFDWRKSEAESSMKKVEWFHNKIISLYGSGKDGNFDTIDKWLLTRLQEAIKETTEALESFQTRKACLKGFFEMSESIRWYEKRGGSNKAVINQALEDWARLVAPFIPHMCEEVWSRMGKKISIFDSKYPEHNKKLEDKGSVALEGMMKSTMDDINSVIKITGMKPRKITLYIAEKWKYGLFLSLQEQAAYIKDRGKLLKNLMTIPEFRDKSKDIMRMLPSIMKNPEKLERSLGQEIEYKFMGKNRDFLGKEFGCEVDVVAADKSGSDKARKAEPGKPGIELA